MLRFFQQMCEDTGYSPQTSFWEDFSIAEYYGSDAIYDTFFKAMREWRKNHVYLTELVMILNWKIWAWYKHDPELSKVYQALYEQANQFAIDNLKDEELDYFLRTVD